MPLLWTEPADVRTRWVGEGLDVEDSQLLTLLADAEDTVLREFPDLPERVDATDGIPVLRVKKVIARVVIRHLRNPAGERSRMDVAGAFTQNVMFGGDNPGALYLTDEDRAELGGAGAGQAFTIDTTPTVLPTSPDTWLAYGGTWVP